MVAVSQVQVLKPLIRPVSCCVLMQEWKHALFFLPYISVVAEKAGHLADVLSCAGARCKGYHGKAESTTPLQPGCACLHDADSTASQPANADMQPCCVWAEPC